MVWTALIIVILVGITGLGLDWGKSAWNIHQLHNAADAGALAGAQVVKFRSQAATRDLARSVALGNDTEGLPVAVQDNPGNDLDGEVVLGRWVTQENGGRGQFFPTTLSPSAVKVVGNRSGTRADGPALKLFFGPVFGTKTVDVSRHAIAWSRVSTGAGIIVLAANPNPLPGWKHDTGLLMDGNTILDLRGVDFATGKPITGDVQVNAVSWRTPWSSFRLDGTSATIWAGELNVVGGTNPPPMDSKWSSYYGDPCLPFSIDANSPRIEDPLAKLTPPNIKTMPIGRDTTGKTYGYDPNTKTYPAINGGTLTLNPGYYPGGIDMNGGSVTLLAGVYAFGGGKNGGSGIVLRGGATVTDGTTSTHTGAGVLLYITGDPSAKPPVAYGTVDVASNATIQATSRGDAMTPRQIQGEMGIAIWQDRANTNYARIIGTSASCLTGTIYCPYNALEIGGNSAQMGSQLIAGALQLHGNPNLDIAYDGRNKVIAYRSILVQ